jgi:hypothetical protein
MLFEPLNFPMLQQVVPAVLLRRQALFLYQLPHTYRRYAQDMSGLFRSDQAHFTKCSTAQRNMNQLYSRWLVEYTGGEAGLGQWVPVFLPFRASWQTAIRSCPSSRRPLCSFRAKWGGTHNTVRFLSHSEATRGRVSRRACSRREVLHTLLTSPTLPLAAANPGTLNLVNHILNPFLDYQKLLLKHAQLAIPCQKLQSKAAHPAEPRPAGP